MCMCVSCVYMHADVFPLLEKIVNNNRVLVKAEIVGNQRRFSASMLRHRCVFILAVEDG